MKTVNIKGVRVQVASIKGPATCIYHPFSMAFREGLCGDCYERKGSRAKEAERAKYRVDLDKVRKAAGVR